MRARHHLDLHLGTGGLQKAAGAAICVDDKDRGVLRAVSGDSLAHGGSDLLGVEVQVGGQAGQVEVIPAIRGLEIENFPRQSAAGDQEDTPAPRRRKPRLGQCAVIGQGHRARPS